MSKDITAEDLDKILQLNVIRNISEMEPGEEELVHSLQYVLEKFKCPLSVSFLNTSFNGWRQKILLNFNFLEKFKSVFSVSMIGSDLKINLRRKYSTSIKKMPEFLQQLVQVLEKDTEKCNKLVQQLREGPIPFHEAIKQFSTNKYKMNLGFCVRNSHILDLFLKDGETYLRAMEHVNVNADMREEEIWKLIHDDQVDELASICLKKLLCKFTEPINQGTLQVLINFGFPVVDKSFLRNYSHMFEGGGDDGVMLKGLPWNVKNERNKSSPQRTSVQSPIKPVVNTKPFTLDSSEFDFADSPPLIPEDRNMALIKDRLKEKSTVVVLGKSVAKPPTFVHAELSSEERLNALLILRGYLDAEIQNAKS